MKKFVILFAVIASLFLTSCASFWNKVDSDGSLVGNTKGSWIVVKQSGGIITDVWKLEDCFVQSEENSDGWLFVNQDGDPTHVGGDMKAIRVKTNEREKFDKYFEYHMEFDTLTYTQRLALNMKKK